MLAEGITGILRPLSTIILEKEEINKETQNCVCFNCPSNSSNRQPDFHYLIPQASVLFWVIFPNCLMISQVESPLSYLVPIIALDTKNYINAPIWESSSWTKKATLCWITTVSSGNNLCTECSTVLDKRAANGCQLNLRNKENSVKVSLAMICFSNYFNLIKDDNNKDLVFLRIYLKIGMFQMFITTQIYCKMPSKMHRSCDPISDYEVNMYLPPTNVCMVISFIEDEL